MIAIPLAVVAAAFGAAVYMAFIWRHGPTNHGRKMTS
jgi:hypothetical protein